LRPNCKRHRVHSIVFVNERAACDCIAPQQQEWLNASRTSTGMGVGEVIAFRRTGRGATRLSAMLVLLGLWAAPAAAQYSGGPSTPPQVAPQSTPGPSSKGKVPLNSYESALRFKQLGNYPKAMELLEPLAKAGHGYEVAQYNLGECYLAVADTKPDPEEAKKSRLSGVGWIIRAAQAGLAPAQQELVRLSLLGGKFKVEPAEAGKWYLVWKRNPTRTQLGVVDLDPSVLRQLNTTLTTADWTEANARADAWHIVIEPGEGPAP
jgi:hypothetical protein